MDENKENNEKENLKDRAENLKNMVNEKAEEFSKEAKGKAETFAGKTMDAAEKLINDVFSKKYKSEETDFEEIKTDPRDIEISELKIELEELREKYVRLYADFDNFRKRTAKEKLELVLVASKDVILDLLPVVDDFERAIKASEKIEEGKIVREGMQLIYNKLIATLTSKGLIAMESVGEDFNPDKHEAISEIEVADKEMQGKVVDEVEKGYLLNGKIIRFAKVVVGKKSE